MVDLLAAARVYNFAMTATRGRAGGAVSATHQAARPRAGKHLGEEPDYEDIEIPRNSAGRLVHLRILRHASSGFALIWHIWWMAAFGFLAMVTTFIVRSCNDDIDYYVPASEVARIEGEHERAVALSLANIRPANARVAAAVRS